MNKKIIETDKYVTFGYGMEDVKAHHKELEEIDRIDKKHRRHITTIFEAFYISLMVILFSIFLEIVEYVLLEFGFDKPEIFVIKMLFVATLIPLAWFYYKYFLDLEDRKTAIIKDDYFKNKSIEGNNDKTKI